MRYNDSGFTHHHNDTNYLSNMRRNLSLWLSLAPKGSITFGTSEAHWRSYFADHLDRMRDANSTVRNLWIMIRAKNARNVDLKAKWEQEIRNHVVTELRCNDWQAATENVVKQRDEAVALKGQLQRSHDRARDLNLILVKQRDEAQEKVAHLTHAWEGMNEIIDRRNQTVKDATERAVDYAHRIATLRSDLDTLARRNVDLIAEVRKLVKRIAFTQDNNVRQAGRIGTLETTVRNLAKRNDTQRDMIRTAVRILQDGDQDMYASLCEAIDVLEGRQV